MPCLSHDPQADAAASGPGRGGEVESVFFLGLECLNVKDRVSPLCQGHGAESLSLTQGFL